MNITIDKLYLIIPTIIFFVSIISFFIGDSIRQFEYRNNTTFFYLVMCSMFCSLVSSGIVIFFIEELLKTIPH